MTRAQGHDTTRKVSARYSQSPNNCPGTSSGGTAASRTAAMTTMGVYTAANRVINASRFDFFSEAFSTRSRMRLTVDSPNSLVTRTVRTPV